MSTDTYNSGAEQATRKRGKRGSGRHQRRAIQRAAQERQQVWTGRDADGRVNSSPVPVRVRIADLATELDDAYAAKRATSATLKNIEARADNADPDKKTDHGGRHAPRRYHS
jgi:hypothetical protein